MLLCHIPSIAIAKERIIHHSFIAGKERDMKQIIAVWLILILCCSVDGKGSDHKEVKEWFTSIQSKQHKTTHLHFYLHDIVGGPNATNIPIAEAKSTAKSPTLFGLLAVIDDPLTKGPTLDSGEVGRAQGLFGSTSLQEVAYHMDFDIVFTNGEYNGSTLSVVGHNPFMREQRELAIVGGSGVFRLARGNALIKTLSFDSTSGSAVVEYNVFVTHY